MAKLKINAYQKSFPKKFEALKAEISETIGNYEINHIGSTAVPGLGGKGIIDIMIAVAKWPEAKIIIKKLNGLGFRHIHPKENSRIFISQKAETKFGDSHIHIVKKQSQAGNDLIVFRNRLRQDHKLKKTYFDLKFKLAEKTKSNRTKYTKLKSEFIEKTVKNSMNRIIFATTNQGKIKEVSAILAGLNIKIISGKKTGLTKDIVENGKTLEENALKKARYANRVTKDWVMADDSGIFIDALDGRPGVKSNRWAGASNIVSYTLKELKAVPKNRRGAYFKTVIALFSPAGKYWIFLGRVDGRISKMTAGKPRPRLQYDTIFIPKGFKKTFAQMPLEQKNKISHRALALKKLEIFLKIRH